MNLLSFSIGFLSCLSLVGIVCGLAALTQNHRQRQLIRQVSDQLHAAMKLRMMNDK